jgi:glycerol-3-phosphate dehydrogenase (NAD(P)+)
MAQKLKQNISFIGAGTIGTALGNTISKGGNCNVILHSIEKDVINSINSSGINRKYFPMIPLNPNLKASSSNEIFKTSDVIFLAIPSIVLMDYFTSIKDYLNPHSILVNLAKGFGQENKSIVSCLKELVPNPICCLKGPTFAREILNGLPSGFTLGYDENSNRKKITALFHHTTIYLDYSTDIEGVEILSILKNIYAIVIGIVDAHFNSPNLRSLILTRAFSEMRDILLLLGGKEETMFKFCGIGDFTHTALNDLSRNRTLGLLIGKGFFTENVSHDLVLEGKMAVNIVYNRLTTISDIDRFPLISELNKILNNKYSITHFIDKILQFG